MKHGGWWGLTLSWGGRRASKLFLGHTPVNRGKDFKNDSHSKCSLEIRVHFFSRRNQKLVKQTSQTNLPPQASSEELIQRQTQGGAVSLHRSAALVAPGTRGSSVNWSWEGTTGECECRDPQWDQEQPPQWGLKGQCVKDPESSSKRLI